LDDQLGATPGDGLAIGDTLVINMTPLILPGWLGFNVGLAGTPNVDQYYAINPLGTDWTIGAEPGTQTFTLHASGTNGSHTSMEVKWRDSWI
jgi:hypothetical protein